MIEFWMIFPGVVVRFLELYLIATKTNSLLGYFALLGARMHSPPPKSRNLSFVVDMGYDFPVFIRRQIEMLETSTIFRSDPNRPTTRGLNVYVSKEKREFEYLTSKKRIEPSSLPENVLNSRTIHIICSPIRALETFESLYSKSIILWEPVPDCCSKETLDDCIKVLSSGRKLLMSPNHLELAAFFGDFTEQEALDTVPTHAEILLKASNYNVPLIIRCGHKGCYVLDKEISRWLPPFYDEPSEKIIDSTGCGNAFLGGAAIGLLQSNENIIEAAILGTVSASIIIEGYGSPDVVHDGTEEQWNGQTITQRIMSYKKHINYCHIQSE